MNDVTESAHGLMIAAPGSLQQSREILRNLAGNEHPPRITTDRARVGHHRAAVESHHTGAALLPAAAIIWSGRRR